jgi:hypothetical protein
MHEHIDLLHGLAAALGEAARRDAPGLATGPLVKAANASAKPALFEDAAWMGSGTSTIGKRRDLIEGN